VSNAGTIRSLSNSGAITGGNGGMGGHVGGWAARGARGCRMSARLRS
jgi:hypothetical protein